MRRENYLLLDSLAVLPEYRRQGIATLLVTSGLVEAKRLGLNVFVQAVKDAVPVYAKAGFKVIDQIVQDGSVCGDNGVLNMYCMDYVVRKPEHWVAPAVSRD